MEHIFILKGLDCPNCSAKIEKEVGELAGVQLSSMNLMKQTLTVQAEASVTNLLDTVTTIVHSHEPDVEVSEKLTATVTKAFLLKGLDCPNCSAKIEKEVGELEGVAESTMNLMQQTLTVQAAPAIASTLLPQVETIVHSHEPDVEVSEKLTATVTKAFLLKGLDCPNCSAKIEKEVGELEGVAESTMNLMQQTLTVKAAPAVASTLLPQVETIVHSHEPDVEVSEKSEDTAAPQEQKKTSIFNAEDKKLTIRLFTGAVLYGIGMALTVFAKVSLPVELAFLIVAYVILGGDVVWQAVKNISRGQIFDEHFLMSLSTIGAFAIGEYPEAVAVMLFYQIGEFFQSLAVKRSRKSISDLMDIRPDVASVLRNGELRTVSPESIAVGETIVVKPGEKIPLDGTILDGSSMLDTKALTGESLPKEVQKGDEVLSGCINQSGVLTIQVTKSFGESTASKIIDLVENASARKAPTENFITTFARYYTPVVVILAALLALLPPILTGGNWAEWLRRGFVFLIVSCPCALVISIPLTFFGGIGAASKRGVLVKGSNYLEALNSLSCKNPYVGFQVLFNVFYAFAVPAAVVFISYGEPAMLILAKIVFFAVFSGAVFTSFTSIMFTGQDNFGAQNTLNQLDELTTSMDQAKLPHGNEETFQDFNIEFRHVDFKYDDNFVLKDFSLTLHQNKTYALIGSSGGGKSTIAKLISGFYPVDGGEILIGGKNIQSYSEKALIQNIAFVFQRSQLLKTSIYENVRIGNPQATRQQIMDALDAANCASILDKFPQREMTVIGAKGVYLSGGEVQRIAIARAILKNANIVIMDEASAAADPENEYELQQAFQKLMRGKTVIMIAHRLSSIQNVDQILFVQNGKVVEQGTHNELMACNGRYKDFQDVYCKANQWRLA